MLYLFRCHADLHVVLGLVEPENIRIFQRPQRRASFWKYRPQILQTALLYVLLHTRSYNQAVENSIYRSISEPK